MKLYFHLKRYTNCARWQTYKLSELILELNKLAGKHGIGRIDHVENRLVGIKSRIYETPAAEVIVNAHKALETITLTKDVAHFKPVIENNSQNKFIMVYGSHL